MALGRAAASEHVPAEEGAVGRQRARSKHDLKLKEPLHLRCRLIQIYNMSLIIGLILDLYFESNYYVFMVCPKKKE